MTGGRPIYLYQSQSNQPCRSSKPAHRRRRAAVQQVRPCNCSHNGTTTNLGTQKDGTAEFPNPRRKKWSRWWASLRLAANTTPLTKRSMKGGVEAMRPLERKLARRGEGPLPHLPQSDGGRAEREKGGRGGGIPAAQQWRRHMSIRRVGERGSADVRRRMVDGG